MRFSRLITLLGSAVAAGGLYLPSVDTDEALIASIAGTPVPRIWEAAERWAQISAALLIIGIVALAFWPRRGRGLRRLAGAGTMLLTVPFGLYVLFAYRDARAAADGLSDSLDLAVFSGLIAESPGASAGVGYLVVLSGLTLVALGGALELMRPGDLPPRSRHPAGEATVESEVRTEASEPRLGSGTPTAAERSTSMLVESGDTREPAAESGTPPAVPGSPRIVAAAQSVGTVGTGAGSAVEGDLGGADTETGGTGAFYESDE